MFDVNIIYIYTDVNIIYYIILYIYMICEYVYKATFTSLNLTWSGFHRNSSRNHEENAMHNGCFHSHGDTPSWMVAL
jgi:hypothetical protein